MTFGNLVIFLGKKLTYYTVMNEPEVRSRERR